MSWGVRRHGRRSPEGGDLTGAEPSARVSRRGADDPQPLRPAARADRDRRRRSERSPRPLALAAGLALTFGIVGGALAALWRRIRRRRLGALVSAFLMLCVGLIMIVPAFNAGFERVLAPLARFLRRLARSPAGNGLDRSGDARGGPRLRLGALRGPDARRGFRARGQRRLARDVDADHDGLCARRGGRPAGGGLRPRQARGKGAAFSSAAPPSSDRPPLRSFSSASAGRSWPGSTVRSRLP